jgi:hypothetical protein
MMIKLPTMPAMPVAIPAFANFFIFRIVDESSICGLMRGSIDMNPSVNMLAKISMKLTVNMTMNSIIEQLPAAQDSSMLAAQEE